MVIFHACPRACLYVEGRSGGVWARAKMAGSTRSSWSSRRLPQVHLPGKLQFPFAFALVRAKWPYSIVRLCLHLIRQRTGYREPYLWPVSYVRLAVGAQCCRSCKRRGVSSKHDRAPRIFTIKNAPSFRNSLVQILPSNLSLSDD